MTVVSMSYLLEAGVHFGHQTKRWNPKMKEYIYNSRDDIYIIDLQKTVEKMEEAYAALNKIASEGGKVLYVGTKKQAQEVCKEEAERSNMYYMTERWLGGTLTNFRTIRRRVNRLIEIENMEKDGTFDKLPKKEVIDIKKEYEKLNAGLEALDYKGKMITLDHDGKNGYRPISELNCYHYIFSVVLGVSKPLYSDKELQKIIDDNNKGFEIDGKHYSMYEGTQLQRKIERAIREQKDTQILAKASGNNELISESQAKITQLTQKYKDLSDISGLPTKMERMRVSGYKRVAKNKLK